jgi:hypothetical protein
MPNATFTNAMPISGVDVVIAVTGRDSFSRKTLKKLFYVSQFRLVVLDRNDVPISLPLTKRAFLGWMNRAIRGRTDYRVSFEQSPLKFTTKEEIDFYAIHVWD